MMHMMQRRTFCILSSTAVTSMLLPLAGCLHITPEPSLQRQLALPAMLGSINDTDTIIELGRAYLDQSDSETNAHHLIERLLIDANGQAIPADADAQTLQRLLADRIRSDFATGATVIINGWVLSLTEVRQCALFALTQTGT